MDNTNKEKLLHLSKQYGVPIELIDVEPIEKYLKENNIPKYKGSFATYYKLFALKFINCNTDKLLYIDADTIVDKSIKELLEYDFKGLPLAMAYDAISLRHKRSIGLHSKEYFNGGVILFNFGKWLEGYQDRILKHINTINGIYPIVDQDLLNIIFENEIALLPNKYNYTTLNTQFSYKNLCNIFQLKEKYYYNYNEVEQCSQKAVIYHALGYFGVQTWNKEGTHPFNSLWDKYLSISPWNDYVKKGVQLTKINIWQKKLYYCLPSFIYNPIHRIAVEYTLRKRVDNNL